MKRILWVMVALFVLLCGVAVAEGTTIIGSGNCGTSGSNVTWQLDSAGTLTIAGTGAMEDYSGSTYVPWYSSRSSIQTAVIQEGITSIGNYTFYGCSGLTSVSIPEGVASIGKSAFSGCVGLTGVYTDSLEGWLRISFLNLGSNPLFSNNATLFISGDPVTDIIIPDGITKINAYAFHSCTSLTSVSIPEGVTLCSSSEK